VIIYRWCCAVAVAVALLLSVLTACNNPAAINGKNFSDAVEQHLQETGDLCLPFIAWPVDVDMQDATARPKNNMPEMMKIMESVGLVQSTEMMLPTQKYVKRYTLTEYARPFLKEKIISGNIPQRYPLKAISNKKKYPVLCWGKMALKDIEQWHVETLISENEANVSYTYRIADMASWADDKGMRWAFPSIVTTMRDQDKIHKIQLRRTGVAWEVDYCHYHSYDFCLHTNSP